MREVDVGTEADEARAWTISVTMTVAQAREVGRVLGERGVHGLFLDGEPADNLRKYAIWRRSQKGGEYDG